MDYPWDQEMRNELGDAWLAVCEAANRAQARLVAEQDPKRRAMYARSVEAAARARDALHQAILEVINA